MSTRKPRHLHRSIAVLHRYALLLCMAWFACTTSVNAGIHIRGEKLEPQADWIEFSQQLPYLRGYGPPDVSIGGKPTAWREDFLQKVSALRQKKQLTADEQADLGGYLLYLKLTSPRQPAYEEAVAVLEAGYRANPRHFALAANLGTAYQLSGRLDAAERCLQNAVDLAPDGLRPLEQLHLRLVQLRLRENLGRGAQPDLDLLFGRAASPFHFVDSSGKWNYGNLAPAEVAKLPGGSSTQAAKQIQQLLMWLPDDGRLHWQLAEWALVKKQDVLALDLLRDAVNTFRLSTPALKQRRVWVQEMMHWRSLLSRLTTRQEPAAWLAETVGHALAASTAPAPFDLGLLQVAYALPMKKSKNEQFGGNVPENGQNSADAPEKPFEFQAWHWVLIGLGIVLMACLLYWQLREWYRRLTSQ